MTEGQHRVVVWSTGGIGSIAIRTIDRRPNLDLVGVWVHSEEKVGKDAGELANGEPIGLAATNDADALIACGPTASCTRQAVPSATLSPVPTTSSSSKPASTSSRQAPPTWSIRAPTNRRSGETSWQRPPSRARSRSTRRASNRVSPPTICRWCCRPSRRRSRRSTLRDRPVRRLRGARHHDQRAGLRSAARLPTVGQLFPAPSPASGRDRSG